MSNKSNMCSGYFPSYITLPNINFYDQINNNNIKDKEYTNYYPFISKGRYRKQIINNHSKYNSKYISKLINLSHQCLKPLPCSRVGTLEDTRTCSDSWVGESATKLGLKICINGSVEHSRVGVATAKGNNQINQFNQFNSDNHIKHNSKYISKLIKPSHQCLKPLPCSRVGTLEDTRAC